MSLENIKTNKQGGFLSPPLKQLRVELDGLVTKKVIGGIEGKQIQVYQIMITTDTEFSADLFSGDEKIWSPLPVAEDGGFFSQAKGNAPLFACNSGGDLNIDLSGPSDGPTTAAIFVHYIYR